MFTPEMQEDTQQRTAQLNLKISDHLLQMPCMIHESRPFLQSVFLVMLCFSAFARHGCHSS